MPWKVPQTPHSGLCSEKTGFNINYRQFPYSGQMERSHQYFWVVLPHQSGTVTLGPHQYWVYGSGARPEQAAQSFDSRYWGPIQEKQILQVATTGK